MSQRRGYCALQDFCRLQDYLLGICVDHVSFCASLFSTFAPGPVRPRGQLPPVIWRTPPGTTSSAGGAVDGLGERLHSVGGRAFFPAVAACHRTNHAVISAPSAATDSSPPQGQVRREQLGLGIREIKRSCAGCELQLALRGHCPPSSA